jgi:glycosyltransferase involved in cell wall biosynthesis
VAPPRLSVVIPTYNYARYLPEAIESVLAQEFRDFELIIVDDCSTDDTAAVVRPFCERDRRVRFSVNPKNLGMVDNWNHCLQQARGDYIKILAGDDKLFHPQSLGKMIALLEKNPSAALASSARAIIDEESKVVDLQAPLADGLQQGRDVITACLMANGKNIVGEPSVVLFRKSDVQRGFDPQYRQVVDVEMWFHLLEKGGLIYTSEPLTAFRVHSRQVTEHNTNTGLAWNEHARFLADWALRDSYPPEVALPILRHLRRSRGKVPDASSPEILDLQRRLITRLGPAWPWSYWTYDIRTRLSAPFRALGHSLKKRKFRAGHRWPQMDTDFIR